MYWVVRFICWIHCVLLSLDLTGLTFYLCLEVFCELSITHSRMGQTDAKSSDSRLWYRCHLWAEVEDSAICSSIRLDEFPLFLSLFYLVSHFHPVELAFTGSSAPHFQLFPFISVWLGFDIGQKPLTQPGPRCQGENRKWVINILR